ncbi:MAG: hypothetical protein EOO89_20900 [Pedobacter sp.]|nr:MAG: hypothetical protein EOO89_20900 [Pedobacter sp.]
MDGRYRLSKYITDTIHAGTFTLLQFNPTKSTGCFIDYTIKHDNNQRTGRIIATWNNQQVTFTDYASPVLGILNCVSSFDYNTEHDRFLFKLTPNVNQVDVTLLVTTI